MQENFGEKIQKIKKEESLEDYQPAVDHLIITGEKNEILEKKNILEKEYSNITEDPKVASYFDKESKIPALEDEINFLESKIESTINRPESPISKETLEKMIMQLRGYQYALKTHNEDLSLRYNNDINVRSAVVKLSSLEEKLKKLDTKLESVVDEYKKRQEDVDNQNPTISLN